MAECGYGIVFEELSSYNGYGIPIRPSDHLEKDLYFDLEDVNDLMFDMAYRAERSAENGERNPMYGKIHTVADIIGFLHNQPRAKVG